MIQKFALSGGLLVASESDASPIQVFVNPDPAEREILQSVFLMDEHDIASTQDPDELSRIEIDGDRTLLIWKRPTNYSGGDSFFFEVASAGFVLFEDRLGIVVSQPFDLSSGGVRQKTALRSPLEVLLWVLLNSIHHYTGHLKAIKMIASEIERKITTSMENKHLIQMFNLSESLIYYLNAINGNGVVLARLRTHLSRQGVSESVHDFVEDLVIENNQCYKQAEIYSTVFSGLMDARGTIVNNNMNSLLKNLTIINVIFLPLNLIAGIGGMSEFTAMTGAVPKWISYPLLCLSMVAIGYLTAIALRRINSEGQRLTNPKKPAV